MLFFSRLFKLPNMTQKRISQKDIAESLNVSVATVSKALRGDYDDIPQETRDKVLNMATKLGYETGTRLRQKFDFEIETKPCMVGVFILRKTHEWQHTSYFAGMTEKCAKMNVSLIMHYVNQDSCWQILDAAQQPPALRDGQLGGLILVNNWPASIAQKLAASLPCVSIQNDYPNMDCIGVDDSQGISQLVEHLVNQGHERIGFFGRCGSIHYARNRFAMYVNALCRLGLAFEPENICDLSPAVLEDKEFDVNKEIEHITRRVYSGVTAWICASDWVGYLLCRGLLNRGLRIPADVSVTGFDNSEDNTLGCPKLTSISVPALRIGAEALRRLLSRIRHPNSPPLKVMLPCRLFEAQTTSAAPTER